MIEILFIGMGLMCLLALVAVMSGINEDSY
jgi:hypothetical protein